MRRTETRPFPASRTALIRCAFFALAKMGARLHSYDEQHGILTATMPWKTIGSVEVLERAIQISVQEHEGTSMLRLVAPQEHSDALLRLISTYVVEGAKAIEDDAHVQWADLFAKEERRRQNRARTRAWIDKLSHLVQQVPLLGNSDAGSAVPAGAQVVEAGAAAAPGEVTAPMTSAIPVPATGAIVRVEPKALALEVPPSPGMLITNRRGQVFEIQVDPRVTADRRRHLVVCPDPACSATNLQGSTYCFHCGKPLTLGAASAEVMRRVLTNAQASLVYGLLSIVPVMLVVLMGVIQLILATGAVSLAAILAAIGDSADLSGPVLDRAMVASTLPALLFTALPGFLLGRTAISRGNAALSDLTLNFLTAKSGRKRATLGRALGTVGMYAGISIFALVLLLFYTRSGS